MFHEDIKELAKQNTDFRRVIYTGAHSQLVLMSIPPEGEIGEETHGHIDQILFSVEGEGETIIEGQPSPFKTHEVVFIPAGTKHNFKNAGSEDLKLYTVYAPPQHKDGTVHKTKADADKDEEDHFQKAVTTDTDLYENL